MEAKPRAGRSDLSIGRVLYQTADGMQFSLLQCGPGKALSRGKAFPSFPLCRAGTPLFSRLGEESSYRHCLPYPCGSAAPVTHHANFCLPGDVKNCLPTHVKNSLPNHVKFCLPHRVKFCLPSHVKKCLTFAISWSNQ